MSDVIRYQQLDPPAAAAESVPALTLRNTHVNAEAAAAQQQAHARSSAEPEVEEGKDASLEQLLNKLGGSITGTRVDIGPGKV